MPLLVRVLDQVGIALSDGFLDVHQPAFHDRQLGFQRVVLKLDVLAQALFVSWLEVQGEYFKSLQLEQLLDAEQNSALVEDEEPALVLLWLLNAFIEHIYDDLCVLDELAAVIVSLLHQLELRLINIAEIQEKQV